MKRKKHNWGVRLTEFPFAKLPVNSEMYIEASIRGPSIEIVFNGTVPRQPLKRPDAILWLEKYKAVLDAALAEAKAHR